MQNLEKVSLDNMKTAHKLVTSIPFCTEYHHDSGRQKRWNRRARALIADGARLVTSSSTAVEHGHGGEEHGGRRLVVSVGVVLFCCLGLFLSLKKKRACREHDSLGFLVVPCLLCLVVQHVVNTGKDSMPSVFD
jgi:hypothetical protein